MSEDNQKEKNQDIASLINKRFLKDSGDAFSMCNRLVSKV